MKLNIRFIWVLVAVVTILMSCDPIEDDSLCKSKIDDVGSPISSTDLKAALSVTQLPNVNGVVKGDQYVIIKNNRPDIGGTWHLIHGTTEETYGTDNDTIICSANGDYQLYYVGISANQIVRTDPFSFKVTNVFDEYDHYLTGATDKSDQSAHKVWKFRKVSWGSICNMGAHGGWKYYTPESNFAWWNNVTSIETIGDQSMEFTYSGNKISTYTPSGDATDVGTFSYTHNVPQDGVKGELITNVPVIGYKYDDVGQNKIKNVLWILTLTDQYMTLYHPANYSGVDWNDDGWYVYYEAK